MTKQRLLLLGALLVVTTSAIAYPILDPGVGATVASGYPSFGADTAQTIYTSSVTAGPFSAGLYAMTCGAKVWADQGASDVTATTSERRIPANFVYPIKIDASSGLYVAIIGTSGGGDTCIFSKDTYP